ncbi:bZIP transcription factor 53-like [Malania oleifera]|uniref:bZIP transcription factor 53-like n=1 Tax=Malania oleifera TaxID=397392 RepID=UPI0025AE2476|nr:bZIP transcription factor 53-like [Malania oleifera]
MDPKNAFVEEKKRKRMISNRESARRSRMRKQMHLDNLTNQKTMLEISNANLVTDISNATAGLTTLEAENRALRMEKMRLQGHLFKFSGNSPATYTWRRRWQQQPQHLQGFMPRFEDSPANPWQQQQLLEIGETNQWLQGGCSSQPFMASDGMFGL